MRRNKYWFGSSESVVYAQANFLRIVVGPFLVERLRSGPNCVFSFAVAFEDAGSLVDLGRHNGRTISKRMNRDGEN